MAIVRKDKMLSGYNGNLESVVVHDASKQVSVPNGVFVTLGDLFTGERGDKKDGINAVKNTYAGEAVKATLATEADIAKEVYLVDGKSYMYDEKIQKDDFKFEVGEVARAYSLSNGDIITLTEDLLVSMPDAVGDKFAVHTDGKLGPVVGDAKITFVAYENAGNELTHRNKAWAFRVVR